VRDLRDLPPSTMLPPEATLLEQYQVGRASLREALRLLEVQGLIVIRPGPGGGPMVAQVDSAHYGRISTLYYHMSGATYSDVAQARSLLEPMLARIATERQDPDDMAALREYLDRYNESVKDSGGVDDYDRYVDETASFHDMVVAMSGNPVLTLTAHSLHDVLLERAHGMFPPEERRHVEQAHAAIARAMLKGEAATVERLMRKHMQEYVEYALVRYPAMYEETVDWH
jgi:DNA-binding FadR family transcriptional regulator